VAQAGDAAGFWIYADGGPRCNPFVRCCVLLFMSSSALYPRGRKQGPAAVGHAGGLALPVTSRERDFWRRAVAEERQRLALAGHELPMELQADRH
jgi:hypothetical protein